MRKEPEKYARAYLLLGGNLREVADYFNRAEKLLSDDLQLIQKSSLYRSAAWGFQSEHDFLNQAWEINTRLAPKNLLERLLATERSLGRQRQSGGYADRPIDIDILFYEQRVLKTPQLILPHPRLHLRGFTLVPLAEIAPHWVHPVFGKTVLELLAELEDLSKVEKIS